MEVHRFEKKYMNIAKKRPATATQRSMMGSKMGASTMKNSKMTGGMKNNIGNPASKPSYMK